jgi:hypothetical protein
MVWYHRTDGATVQTVLLLGAAILMYRPGQLPERSSIINGELQAGGVMHMFDRVL